MKFKSFGANLELVGNPDSELMRVVLENNITFNNLKITNIRLT